MSSITIHMKDGTVRRFPHEGRAGGGYTKTLKYVPGFAVVEDEWGTRTAIPAEDIAEIVEEPNRPSW